MSEDAKVPSIVLIQTWRGRERRATETDPVTLTRHQARLLAKKWSTGIRKWWPGGYEIEGDLVTEDQAEVG